MLHTEILGKKSETDSHDEFKSHSDILVDANDILRANNCETASVGQSVGKSVFGKVLYLEMLARFSSIDHLITGLAAITCRVRKVPREHAGNWNSVKRQVWEKLLRSSQTYFPPQNIKQLIPEKSRAGVIITRNRLSSYGLVKFHQCASLGIVSHVDTALCHILLLRAHSAVGNGTNIHLAGNLTGTRLRTGRLAVAITRGQL